jgi:glyoxalase family protein
VQLEGIHHITCITADARRNVDFYARVLGLRLVKKTVNFDAPEVYHLYYGDERGSPGSILTFFEFPDAAPGRAGAGMIHRLRWRVASEDSLAFWAERLVREGLELEASAAGQTLHFRDPEGLRLALAVLDSDDEPLRAHSDEIPAEHALLGFDGVDVYGTDPEREDLLLTRELGFTMSGDASYILEGAQRRATYSYHEPPPTFGIQGAGTVHHIAWRDRDEDHVAWQEQLARIGARPTPIIDRQYFLSIYFREPRGVLFELATPSPGFAIDEDPKHLGEELRLPPQYEHLRARLEASLIPLENPRVKTART